MRELLFLAHRIPYPPNKGDKIRSWHFLSHFTETHKVHLGCFIDDPNDRQHVHLLKERCDQTHFADLTPRSAKLRSLTGLLNGKPLSLPYYQDSGLARWTAEILARPELAAVFTFSSAMAQYVMSGTRPGVRRVMDFVDVDSDKWRQYASTSQWPRSAIYRREQRELLAFERRVAAVFDASVLVSPAEADLFRTLAPESAEKIGHINNGVDADFFAPDPSFENPFAGQRDVLAFTGMMDYWPNIDAVDWMARTILPKIRQHRPDASFYIVGAAPAPNVTALGALPGVTVTGRVPDVRPYLAHADVFVAPLRISRGVQNKVLEGMAMARPVVATTDAYEGIDAEKGREIVVADGADAFASRVVELLDTRDRAAEIGRAARMRVIESYGWQASFARLDALCGSDGTTPPTGNITSRAAAR